MKKFWLAGAMLVFGAGGALADSWGEGQQSCSLPQSLVNSVLSTLATVAKENNGSLFSSVRMWAAVVDRKGILCNVIRNSTDAWPGSRDIAIAKASTANDFSNDVLALSTANIYGPTQPGGSLYGLNNSNPFNPAFNAQGSGIGYADGGIITFGGGVALYDAGKHVIGGLGVSGDTSCADHAVAYRMRHLASLDNIPSGVGPGGTDNISYYTGAGPGGLITSPTQVDPSKFSQPHCLGAADITP
jgi:uncharacterized protein GlcG (DUF336 family)